jgi:excinuclease ABC subunit A
VEESIQIRGAQIHNLKNISLAITQPVDGCDGRVEFREVLARLRYRLRRGQQRYVGRSRRTRGSFWASGKPDVDEIVASSGHCDPPEEHEPQSASTVATSTECYDFLRLLFARVGRTYCPQCGKRVEKDTVDQVAAQMLAQPAGSRWYVLFPAIGGQAVPPVKSAHPDTQRLRDHLFELRKKVSIAFFRKGACSSSRPPNRCWILISQSRYTCWRIALPLRRIYTSGWPIPRKSPTANRAK